jgi:hypothetical protein
VGIPCLGRSPRNGADCRSWRGAEFLAKCRCGRPPRAYPRPPLVAPVSKPNPRGADSVPLHKKGQPERVTRFVPRDSLPRPGWLEEDSQDVLQGGTEAGPCAQDGEQPSPGITRRAHRVDAVVGARAMPLDAPAPSGQHQTSSNDRPPCLENSHRTAAEYGSPAKTATFHFMLNQDIPSA